LLVNSTEIKGFSLPDVIPDVLLGVESFRTEVTLEPVGRHLVGFNHMASQLSFNHILQIAEVFVLYDTVHI